MSKTTDTPADTSTTSPAALAGSGQQQADQLYDEAVALVRSEQRCSISLLQRRLGLGYARAMAMIELLVAGGIVSTSCDDAGKRTVFAAPIAPPPAPAVQPADVGQNPVSGLDEHVELSINEYAWLLEQADPENWHTNAYYAVRKLAARAVAATALAADNARLTAELSAATAERDRLAGIVDRLPKDKDGKPMAVGMYALASGYEMGNWAEADAEPYEVVSVCTDHVWLSKKPDDQNCLYASQCRVFDTLKDAEAAALASQSPPTAKTNTD